MTARPPLDDIRHMPVRDLITLPAEQLVRLRREARMALDAAAIFERWLDGIARIQGGA
jgi:hypothetical protein